MTINITDIQKFCIHDGPGIRTTVFLNGCPLSCKWCHNPEAKLVGNRVFYTASKCIMCGACSFCEAHTFNESGHHYDRSKCISCGKCADVCPASALENTVKTLEISAVADEVEKDIAFYGEHGGLTLSGGEPMLQPEAAIALLKECKKREINTAVETCGFFNKMHLNELKNSADMLLWDIKDTDPVRHKKNVGVPPNVIVENLLYADSLGIKTRLRCIMLEGINANEEHVNKIKALFSRLNNCLGIDFIPYHPMGKSKYERLGIEDTFDDKKYIPERNITL